MEAQEALRSSVSPVKCPTPGQIQTDLLSDKPLDSLVYPLTPLCQTDGLISSIGWRDYSYQVKSPALLTLLLVRGLDTYTCKGSVWPHHTWLTNYILSSSSTLYISTAGQKIALKIPSTPAQNVAACWM